jgi:large subunit ribosomal protein L21
LSLLCNNMATMEFAVIQTGGKQYKVKAGDSLKIEKIKPVEGADLKVGDTVTFDKVLLVNGAKATTIGTPFVPAASVTATLEEIGRYKTIDVIKYKQKSRYFKKNGHRQPFFKVKISAIK